MDKREWKLYIGTRHYYLTTEEKNYYLESINKGADYCAIRNGDIILPKNMQELIRVSIEDETEKLDKGMYQCDRMKWHAKKAECLCGEEYEIIDGVAKVKQIEAISR